ncbi:hypothetical protein [Litoribacillus peritrichatus]|uniref:Uncharacterized protein n=1 Tax=Litoribacillus peritrichatus TaxID=718191 RepID=A0ABP7N2N4_9GAMM
MSNDSGAGSYPEGQALYVVLFKCKVLPECSFVMDDSAHLFGVCLVYEKSETFAKEVVKAELANDHLVLGHVFLCSLFRSQEWREDIPEHNEMLGLAEKACRERQLCFGTFISEEIIAEQRLDAWLALYSADAL